jgi:ZIP family zinc transporter
MGEAFVWGLVGGSSLVIGGVVALRVAITRRLLGLIMAFGAGVLISAVAYELVHEGVRDLSRERRDSRRPPRRVQPSFSQRRC